MKNYKLNILTAQFTGFTVFYPWCHILANYLHETWYLSKVNHTLNYHKVLIYLTFFAKVCIMQPVYANTQEKTTDNLVRSPLQSISYSSCVISLEWHLTPTAQHKLWHKNTRLGGCAQTHLQHMRVHLHTQNRHRPLADYILSAICHRKPKYTDFSHT